MKTIQPTNTDYITRRQNASPIGAGVCASLFGVFASVPIGIRQRDWKIPVFSMGAALLVVFASPPETYRELRIVGNITGGLVAFALVNKNKNAVTP